LDKKLEKSEKKQDKQSEFHEISKKNPLLKQFLVSLRRVMDFEWLFFKVFFFIEMH
jgi:hypothetical protein